MAVHSQVAVVVVGDNGSNSSADIEMLCTGFSDIDLVPFGEDEGIAAAQNAGVNGLLPHLLEGSSVLRIDQDIVPLALLVGAYGGLEAATRRCRGIIDLTPPGYAVHTTCASKLVRREREAVDLGPFTGMNSGVASGSVVRRQALEDRSGSRMASSPRLAAEGRRGVATWLVQLIALARSGCATA